MAASFEQIRGIERREIDQLAAHLARLDSDGWLEQSYCAEWRVYQVVAHLASGALLLLGSLEHWFDGGPAMTQERRQAIWDRFDALDAGEMHEAFRSAIRDYFARLEALPAEAGQKEVVSFLGTVPVQSMLAVRLGEVALHSWVILAARDRSARIPADAVEIILPVQLHFRAMRVPAALAGQRVRLRTPDGDWQRLIDFRGEKPVVSAEATAEAEINVEAPTEELCRLLSGRHFLPGSLPRLTRQGGTYREMLALNAFEA